MMRALTYVLAKAKPSGELLQLTTLEYGTVHDARCLTVYLDPATRLVWKRVEFSIYGDDEWQRATEPLP